jgi:hypothetical protein
VGFYVWATRHYKLEGFSVERLMHFVTALKHDVVIEIRPRAMSKGAARISIVRAGKAALGGRRLGLGKVTGTGPKKRVAVLA